MIIFRRPSCPDFHKTAIPALVTRSAADSDVHASESSACKQTQEAVKLTDPMKSIAINAWLRGQLTAPT